MSYMCRYSSQSKDLQYEINGLATAAIVPLIQRYEWKEKDYQILVVFITSDPHLYPSMGFRIDGDWQSVYLQL